MTYKNTPIASYVTTIGNCVKTWATGGGEVVEAQLAVRLFTTLEV